VSLTASRLTLYAVLSSIEEDLREVALTQLGPQASPERLLGADVFAKAQERLSRDVISLGEVPDLEQLLLYIDLGDLFALLNAHRQLLPNELAKYFKTVTPDLEKLVPIRNRVAHSRPLGLDDLASALAVAERFASEAPKTWRALRGTVERLRKEPGFVFGIEIPRLEAPETEVRHNLPIPDFDETGFVGRAKQVQSLRELCSGPYPVISILGEGALGKTALVMKVVYDLIEEDDFAFDAVVWSTAKSTQITPNEIVRIEGAVRDSLGLIQTVVDEVSGVATEDPFGEVLEYMAEFRILLILDNLETVLDTRLNDFLERLPTGSKVLITSRKGLGAFEAPLKLTPLNDSDAVQLLRSLAQVRGVPQLVKMPNEKLEEYCKRMQRNPGFIKWFVAAVQAGRRPEEVLAKSGLFLDFCMSNVYGYLSEHSREVLAAMVSIPGTHSQGELAIITGLSVDDLQGALQELMTTNMITMASVPRGSSYESYYDVAELARAYLEKHHPPKPEQTRSLRQRRQRLIATGEQLRSRQIDRYALGSLAMRTRSELAVARDLLDALASIRTRDFAHAADLLSRAHALAPGYFDVYRIEALLRAEQGNLVEARAAYETAIELEPDNAPLRRWYGGFLLRYEDDAPGALEQFERANHLDPDAIQIEVEMARTRLALGDFSSAKQIIDKVLSRPTLGVWERRLAFNIALDWHQRRAAERFAHRDIDGALEALDGLIAAFDSCGPGLIDGRMRGKVALALPTLRAMQASNPRSSQRSRLDALVERVLMGAGAYAQRPPIESENGHAKQVGRIEAVMQDKGYGFIKSRTGHSFFFHRKDMKEAKSWRDGLQPGQLVKFTIGENERGKCAIQVELVGRDI
jgi:Tfp pilus assembly protein PilF/cold shock CspA family protein